MSDIDDITTNLAKSGVPPLAAAAIMTKLAMMLYKTSLSAEDYNFMIDQIANSRDLIRTMEEYMTSGRLN
jgi:hypothetical protein